MNDQDKIFEIAATLSFPLGMALVNIVKAGSSTGEESDLLLQDVIGSVRFEMIARAERAKEAEKAAKRAEKAKADAPKRGRKLREIPTVTQDPPKASVIEAPAAKAPAKSVAATTAAAKAKKTEPEVNEDDELEEGLVTAPVAQEDLM